MAPHTLIRGLAAIAVAAILASSGCAPQDDTVWDRVERGGPYNVNRTPACHGEVPPVVTPGQAAQDSLEQHQESNPDSSSSD